MSEIRRQKSMKSRVNDELQALREQEIAKNRRGNFKDEGCKFWNLEVLFLYHESIFLCLYIAQA